MTGGIKPPNGGQSMGDSGPIKRSTRPTKPVTSERGIDQAKSRLADGARSKPSRVSGNDAGGHHKAKQGIDRSTENKDNPIDIPKDTTANKENSGDNPKVNTQPSNDSKTGLVDKAKGLTSNATGVDYSDKSLKDQLEHQAADMAMDATPGLGQVNSARKALKNYNKAKKDMGGKEGLSDKVEDVADDAVDKGIKGVKILAGAKIGADAGLSAMAMAMIIKTLMMLKAMALAVLGKIAGIFGAVFHAISGFISGVLGVTAAVGQAIAGGFMAVVLTTASMLGYAFFDTVTKKDDSGADCVPTTTRVPKGDSDYQFGDGGIAATNEENAKKLWSVYSALGGSKAQTAAVLGNLHLESGGLDPTAVETIYNEPYKMGPRKQDATDKDFLMSAVDPSYSARFPAIKYMGIGLAQWTNGRNRLLIDYAKSQNLKWYEFDTQMKFMLVADDKVRQKQLKTFLKDKPKNVSKETERFMNTWVGLSSPNPSLKARQNYATDYMFSLERIDADTSYAESILSGLNVDRSAGNAAAGSYNQDDGCGKPIKSHYANESVDGTGEVPAGLTLVPWSRETLPDSLKEFSKNPEDAGLAWGNASGWANGIIPNQCVALSVSYFMRIYPNWNKNGLATTRPFGNGKDMAPAWAAHYHEKVSKIPKGGSIFSDSTTSSYGHTGIVQHVFANGDILIIEQNVRGISGEANGMNYSWGWRVIKKDRYLDSKWKFFKPAKEDPQWGSSGN